MLGDATLLTIRATLSAPEAYVRAVLERLWACKRDHGDAQVRLCVRGDGGAPDYRVETIMDPETGQSMEIGAYSGKTHKPLAYERYERISYWLWSSEVTDIEVVAALLGDIRN